MIFVHEGTLGLVVRTRRTFVQIQREKESFNVSLLYKLCIVGSLCLFAIRKKINGDVDRQGEYRAICLFEC